MAGQHKLRVDAHGRLLERIRSPTVGHEQRLRSLTLATLHGKQEPAGGSRQKHRGGIGFLAEITITPRDRERTTRLLSVGRVHQESLHKAGPATRWAS